MAKRGGTGAQPEILRALAEAAEGPPFDVVIIGGGINGCAIARETARRGLRTALFEQDDFGFGTTWRSTKLIHGGLRYLEHGDVRLVFESLRERAWLLKTRPHLVQPQRFIMPMLPWTRRPAWQLRAGLSLYDALALYRGVPRHRRLGERQLREVAPGVAGPTEGAFTFYDARVSAPERLALELALEARLARVLIVNHAPVTGIEVQKGRVSGVTVAIGEAGFGVPAKYVVNAAGPWVDAVNALTGEPATRLLGVTRGSHLVFEPPEPPGDDAVFSTAKSDGRVFFTVPQGRLLLVGTTDDRFDGQPGTVRPTMEDAEYLLAEAQTLLPGSGLTMEHVRYAYAGLRPLRRMAGGPEAAITRRHSVIDHGMRGGPAGLLSVVGGKLSTFRPLAREVAEEVGAAEAVAENEGHPGLPKAGLPARLSMYGEAANGVLGLGSDVVCEHSGALSGEVLHATRAEAASTLSDILMRRTGIVWGSCRGLCCRDDVARMAAKELGWSAAETKRQLAAFEADVTRHLPCVAELESERDGDG